MKWAGGRTHWKGRDPLAPVHEGDPGERKRKGSMFIGLASQTLKVRKNSLEILLRCRFQFSKFGLQLEILHFLISSQVRPVPLVQGPQFEKQWWRSR